MFFNCLTTICDGASLKVKFVESVYIYFLLIYIIYRDCHPFPGLQPQIPVTNINLIIAQIKDGWFLFFFVNATLEKQPPFFFFLGGGGTEC